MPNGPYAIFTIGRDPEHIEGKEQSIIKKGEKQKMKIKNYKCKCGSDEFFYTVENIHYGSEVVTYQRDKVLNFSIVG